MKTYLAVSLAAVCLILSHARASTVSVVGDPGDGLIATDPMPIHPSNLTTPTIRPGTGGNAPGGQVGIYLFRLPTFPVSSVITSADIHLAYLGIDVNTPEFNIDLFALGERNTATLLASDYYVGTSAGGSGTLIQAAFITSITPTGILDLSITAQNTFTGYLQSQYSGGNPLDQYLMLRVNPDEALPYPSAPIRGYLMATADNPDSGLVPLLTINTVPEPSTVVLAGLAGLTLLAFRGKRLEFASGLVHPSPILNT